MKINAIVQARMGSTRFPGKVMVEVDGKPLIGHLLDHIIAADVDEVIVAIPHTDKDSALRHYLSEIGVAFSVWNGPESDVAGRFCYTLTGFPCDAFIRVCADSPCLTSSMVSSVASSLRENIAYVHFTAGVAGTQVQGISTDVFLAYLDEFDEYDREHVLSYFTRTMSLVVDTPEDLERIRPVLENKMDLDGWMSHILPA